MIKTTPDAVPGQSMTDALKGWVMVLMTLVFIVLYGLALVGRLKPLSDVSMVTRLEPIIFVIIGYYFGRMPAQQNEKTLKDEIGRQTQKADAAQHAKEQSLQSREALEEKIKNVRVALAAAAPTNNVAVGPGSHGNDEPIRSAQVAALNILNS